MAKKVAALIAAAYGALVQGAGYLQHPFLLGVRLFWGYQFFLAGRGKLGNIEGPTAFFTELGIPLPRLNAYVAGSTECFGGLLLMAGLASRLVSAPLAFTMIVAYGTAHVDAVRTIFQDPDKFIGEAPFLFLMASLIVLIFGPGALSLDALVKWLVLPRLGLAKAAEGDRKEA